MTMYNIGISVLAVVAALYIGIAIEYNRPPSYSAAERDACRQVEKTALAAGWGAAQPDSLCGRILGR